MKRNISPAEKAIFAADDELRAWTSYEYFEGGHKYNAVHYEVDSGPNNASYVSAEDTLWTIDTPEQPNSILFFLQYYFWRHESPGDLRNARLSFFLRGDDLKLYGAKCYFWVVTYGPTATRWHLVGRPISIPEGCWEDEPVQMELEADSALWHRSFVSGGNQPSSLERTLGSCFSYGFSFVGFSQKVTGKISLSSFKLETKEQPGWPFTYNFRCSNADWLTVSRSRKKQVSFMEGQEGVDSFLGGGEKGSRILINDDYLLFNNEVSFAYLAYIRSKHSTRGRDLRNSVIIIRQQEEDFNLHGGRVAFFVEHGASSTRWIFRVSIDNFDDQPWYNYLVADENVWLRLTGDLGLDEVLAGGYDYLGLMAVDCQEAPSGLWELSQFSVGPTMER